MADQLTTDPLDIAYLAIGADHAWRTVADNANTSRPHCFDGIGQDGVIAEVITAAPALKAAWDRLGADGWAGGVWYYDVPEPLGDWFVRQWVEHGARPDDAAIAARIDVLIAESST